MSVIFLCRLLKPLGGVVLTSIELSPVARLKPLNASPFYKVSIVQQRLILLELLSSIVNETTLNNLLDNNVN